VLARSPIPEEGQETCVEMRFPSRGDDGVFGLRILDEVAVHEIIERVPRYADATSFQPLARASSAESSGSQ
jgi:hypothetical protein